VRRKGRLGAAHGFKPIKELDDRKAESISVVARRIQPMSVESAESRVRIQAKWLSEVGLTTKPVALPLSFDSGFSLSGCIC
jgi:hypothetical protein